MITSVVRAYSMAAAIRLLFAVAAIALAAFVTAVACASNFRFVAPGFALRVAPWDAQAQAVRASMRLITDPTNAGFASAERDVQDALRDEPIQAIALRVAGSIVDARGQPARALALITAAERLSRRDPLTQLWLIEYLSRTDDVVGVLRHYEIALSGSDVTVPILYPVLIAASNDPTMARPLEAFLKRNRTREWRNTLLTEMITKSPGPSNMAQIALAVLRHESTDDLAHYHEIIDRLLPMANFDLAFSAYAHATGAVTASPTQLRDMTFRAEGAKRFPPFDWQYVDEPDRSAQPGRSRDLSFVTLSASSTARGPMLHQIVRLMPGRYRFEVGALGPSPESGSLSAVVACVQTPSDPSPLAQRLQLDFSGRRATVELTLTSECVWRSVGIDYDGTGSGEDLVMSIGDMVLTPLIAKVP